MSGDFTAPAVPIDDVFAFCNHLAWRAGGPVLIHDSTWGVIAYSTLNQAIDEGRRAVILRRAVPDREAEERILRESEELFAGPVESFEVFAVEGVQQRRVVAPVRLLGVLVGSIWIAESAGDLPPDALQMVQEAAKQAAFYFQLNDDARRRESDRFARMLLDGSQEEGHLAQYLGVPVSASFQVVAVCHGADGDLRQQARQVVRILAAKRDLDHVILEGECCLHVAFYVPEASARLAAATRAFAQDVAVADERLLIGLGRVTSRLGHAAKSKADADKVVTYLQRTPGQRVGSVSTLRTQMTLMRLVEILDGQFEPLLGSLQGLAALEPGDREDAIRTLDAYFDHPGNASEAARHLHVHPNTFRYRLAKVSDILAVDLDDRDTRIVIELDLLRHRYGNQG